MIAGRPTLEGYAHAAGVVVLATLVCWLMFGRFDRSNLIMVYLLGVCYVGTRHRQGPSAFAAILSVAAFDFFFVPPYLTLAVHEGEWMVSFAVMLIVGLLISTLAVRAREHSEAARRLAVEGEAARVAADREALRNALLSSVSHDLRTPLGVIEGAASTLLDDEATLDTETRRDLAETIHEEAERLHRQVRNLLDMTRLESGPPVLRVEWESLEEVVGGALRRMDPALAERPVSVEMPEALPLVACDAVLFEQVLVNLLENAVKYSPAGSPVEVRAAEAAGEMVVTIADRGPGVAAGDAERIFDKFYRATRDEGREGVGLGLAICRAIMTAHGGRIWVEGREGGGAAFHAALPRKEPPPAPGEEAAEERPATPPEGTR